MRAVVTKVGGQSHFCAIHFSRTRYRVPT